MWALQNQIKTSSHTFLIHLCSCCSPDLQPGLAFFSMVKRGSNSFRLNNLCICKARSSQEPENYALRPKLLVVNKKLLSFHRSSICRLLSHIFFSWVRCILHLNDHRIVQNAFSILLPFFWRFRWNKMERRGTGCGRSEMSLPKTFCELFRWQKGRWLYGNEITFPRLWVRAGGRSLYFTSKESNKEWACHPKFRKPPEVRTSSIPDKRVGKCLEERNPDI